MVFISVAGSASGSRYNTSSNFKTGYLQHLREFPFSKQFFVVYILLSRRTPYFQQFKIKENLTYFSAKYVILIQIRLRTLLKCRIWIRKQCIQIRNPAWFYSHKYFPNPVLVMKTSQNNREKILLVPVKH